MARVWTLTTHLNKVVSISLQFSLALATVHKRFQYPRALQGSAEISDAPARNWLQYNGVPLLIHKGARPLLDAKLLQQLARDYQLHFGGEANRTLLRSSPHDLVITIRQSIVRFDANFR
jgi:hypothetical protein